MKDSLQQRTFFEEKFFNVYQLHKAGNFFEDELLISLIICAFR